MATSLNNIVFGGQTNPGFTQNVRSAGEFMLERLDQSSDKTILVDGLNGTEINGKAFKETVVRFARCLENLGVKEGDVVGISCENRLEFAYTIYGTVLLNATVAPYNVTYTEREIHHAFSLSKPKVIFASGSTIQKISKVAQKNAFVKHLVSFDESFKAKNIIPYKTFLGNAKANLSTEFKPRPVNMSENVFLILCSSGTTGMPKGVQLTQKNILKTVDTQFESKTMLEDATLLSVIPWFHAMGCLSLVMITLLGARMVFLPKFQEHQFLSCIQNYKVDASFMVPPLMVFLAKHPMVDNYDLSSLKILLCGAAPLSKETADAVRDRIGVPIIRQGYGLSEATLSLLVQTDGHDKPGSVGTLKPGTYAKVLDTETGKPLGPHQRGELCFKGDIIMKGYVGDPKATSDIIDSEGWLHTGDVGYYDEDFDFFIVDRIKELIKYKGFQVPPAEIEGLLLTHPKIRDAAVIGLPDEASGELPMAFVVKQDDVSLTPQEVIDYVAERASPAKRLHGGVRFVDEIPKNPTGKILRRILRDMVKTKSKL